ncbi:MAG: MerR family transcriptional regulator [Bdellovibrio sp.]
MKDWLSIGEFSKQTGFSNKALRLYEEKGLLLPYARSESQYRTYRCDQLATATKIQQYKKLGFSLEQIKTILKETCQSTLKEYLEERLKESTLSLQQLSEQVIHLKSILTSLNAGEVLTDQQRSHVMENLLATSVDNLKRRGIIPTKETVNSLTREVDHFSEDLIKILPGIQTVMDFAKTNNIFLGPGRASSLASLVLFGQGYSPINPMRFGLLPEIFATAKMVWLDVEYSRHQEIGELCDKIFPKSSVEILAFRSPILDIYRTMQNKIGVVHFDDFSDDDPILFDAPVTLGLRGLWDLDWSPNFDAFKHWDDPEAKKRLNNAAEELKTWCQQNRIKDAHDFINISYLYYSLGPNRLNEYTNGVCPAHLPELKATNGLLFYREDWIKIFARYGNVDNYKAIEVLKLIRENKNQDAILKAMDIIKDKEIRKYLLEKSKNLFLKSHMISSWWHYKRTAILKTLWPKEYLATIEDWEQKNNCIWQEFGYRRIDGSLFLKANCS